MQLKDIVPSIEDMSDEQLLERLRTIRHNRITARPAGKAREKRATKKTSKVKVTKVENLLTGLSKEDMLKLIAQLGEG